MTNGVPAIAGSTVLAGRFSTAHLAEHDRYSAWRDRSASLASRYYETQPYEPFGVSNDLVVLGSLKLVFSTISGQYFERTRAMADADGVDDLVVNVRFHGGATGDMNGVALDARSGSIVMTDMAQPQGHRSEASSSAYFHIPRAMAEQFLPGVRSLHGAMIAPDDATLVREHLLQIWRNADRLPLDQGQRLAGTVMDLLAVAVAQGRGEAAPDATATAMQARARAEIETRLGSATLTVASLCRRLGVSRSALYRLFELEDGVQAYITRRRLERVAHELRNPVSDGRIADIADRWGFCDAAYMGRLFRQRFGMTPGEFRAFSRGRAR